MCVIHVCRDKPRFFSQVLELICAMCDVSDCTATRDVYRPVDSTPLVVGNVISCQLATEVTCVSLRAGAPVPNSDAPSPSPLAAASQSSTPSASPVSSSSSTPSATPSTSPPSAAVAIGSACDVTTTCVSGADCSCLGTCEKIVSFDLVAMADDKVEPWMCGTSIGSVTANQYEAKTWTYNGVCSDLYLEVDNARGGHTGVVGAIRESGETSWTPMVFTGGAGVTGVVAYNPAAGFMTDPAYDFSSWTEPVLQNSKFGGDAVYLAFQSTYGSDFWTHEDGHLGSAADITFYNAWYKISLPFC